MKKVVLFTSLLLWGFTGSLTAIEIFMVEPEFISSTVIPEGFVDLPNKIYTEVDALDELNTINISLLDNDLPVRSLIDAGALSMRHSLPYLLYGTVQITDHWCEARLSLYEQETDSIRTVFYSKVVSDRHTDLSYELARKLKKYLYSEFGIEDRQLIDKSPGYFELSLNPGYWMVLNDQWNQTLLGYFNGGISAKFALSEPKLYFNGNEMYPRFGLDLEYGIGRNQSGVENYFYHSLQVGLPLEFVLELKQIHRFGISVAPAYQYDLLDQQRKYGGSYSSVSGAFVLKTAVLYSFSPLDGKFSFGLKNQIDITFYNDLLISYKPSLIFSYKFPFQDNSNEN